MKKLTFDAGVEEYQVNGNGALRFNPRDPNLYARFLQAQDKILAIEEELIRGGLNLPENATPEEQGAAAVGIMAEADRRTKEVLAWVFGAENDFDALLGGVNLLAVGANGERVVTNLFAALLPIIEAGAQAVANEKSGQAAAAAKARRAQRGAGGKA